MSRCWLGNLFWLEDMLAKFRQTERICISKPIFFRGKSSIGVNLLSRCAFSDGEWQKSGVPLHILTGDISRVS